MAEVGAGVAGGDVPVQVSLPGIGEWTAQYVAMRALREPDAFPTAGYAGDDEVVGFELIVVAVADEGHPLVGIGRPEGAVLVAEEGLRQRRAIRLVIVHQRIERAGTRAITFVYWSSTMATRATTMSTNPAARSRSN